MLNQLYHKLEESGQVSINCIDWIQHFRRIVNNYKIGNVTASLNSIIFLFRQYIESTNVKSETFSIKALIDNTVSKIKQDFENEDIELNIQNDIQNLVIGDSFRIKAVLSQLIGSAIINSIKNCKIAINVNQNSKILHDTIEDTSLQRNIAEAFSKKLQNRF
ncbi:hypothetical protein OCHUTO_1100 [Orientia chuto str. Dubai]|uniref:Uncharacterized protein n=1 Tax=Orientia chuto str. Dubai TaxID=1359168 RepID=A0A0F3MG09_9RICK|nr:hypothetical protein OCHUTO_1100 [Orientia chuto str. Dubai]